MFPRPLIRTVVLAAAAAVVTIAATPAAADSLGVANDYNVFVLGNITKSNVDAQGKVAVGGNANFNNYSVGSSLSSSTTNLIVNGNLTKTGGGTLKGNVLVNGNANISNPTITGKLQVNGNTTIPPGGGGSVTGGVVHNGSYTAPSYFSHTTGYTPLPFSFADAASYLTTQSTFWGSLAANGTTTSPYNNLTLTGTNSTLNVFTVDASTLGSANNLKITAPAGSTVLVNVVGTTVNVPSMGINLLGGLDKQHVLYNFPTATSVQFNSIGVLGSVLAPKANVDFRWGNIDGTLIAKNLTGTGEEHNFRFTGSLPTAVPLPASATAGATLLTGLALSRRRRRHD